MKSNKYKNWYFRIIENAIKCNTNKSQGDTERHHILPKFLGGNNNSNNLVRLTTREHFICHYLLIKFVPDIFVARATLACSMMLNTSWSHKNLRYKPKSSEIYASLRKTAVGI